MGGYEEDGRCNEECRKRIIKYYEQVRNTVGGGKPHVRARVKCVAVLDKKDAREEAFLKV
jgi:hypothetical protein